MIESTFQDKSATMEFIISVETVENNIFYVSRTLTISIIDGGINI